MATCNHVGCTCKNLYDTDWAVGNRSGVCEDCGHDKTQHERSAPFQVGVVAASVGHTEELREEMKEMKAMLRSKTSFVLNTQSRAEAIDTMTRDGSYTFSADLNLALQEFRVEWWPQGASRKFPSETSAEKLHCQPFVSKILSLFTSGKVALEGRAKKHSVTILSIPNPKAYTQMTLGSRSPDITMYDGPNKMGTSALTLVAEVKGGGKGEFPPDQVGQVTDTLSRTMNKQPQRQRMYGFLTDGRRFLFIECIRLGKGYQFRHSTIFVGEAGWQIVFGMMLADPSALGYERVVVPGFVVGDLLGVGSFSAVFQAERSKKAAARIVQEAVPALNLPPGLRAHRVLGDGNCFFHAIAHQLQTNNVAQEGGQPYTHEVLRQVTIDSVEAHPALRHFMSDNEYVDLLHLTGYVDHAAIAAMALALNIRITIFGTYEGQQSFGADGMLGSEVVGRATLRIVYNGIDHYDSVVNDQGVAEAVLAAQKDLPAETVGGKRYNLRVQPEPPAKRVKTEKVDELPVAVKIFEKKHKKMRNHERDVLQKLKRCNFVPSVVEVLDVCGKPAIIVSPAGNKVLPVKGGVRANKTDFVKLLQALQTAHDAKLCHRDVKPENIFKDRHSRVVLNDWSSAATTDVNVPWAGTQFYYSKGGDIHAPRAADDLVALVRSVHAMYTNARPVEGDTDRVLESSPLWRAALQHAREGNYDELRKFFNNL